MIRHFLLCKTLRATLFVVLCVALCLSGCTACGASEARYFAFRAAPFEASVSGKIDGLEIRAELSFDGAVRTVRYLSPPSLSGLCVCADESGAARATLDGLTYTADAEALSGLLLPISLLLDAPSAVRAVKREGNATVLSLEGVTLTLDGSLTPIRVSSPRADLAISWHAQRDG